MTALEVELSQFVTGLDWDDVPPPVQERVLDIWADTVANALAGRRAAGTPIVARLAERLCGSGDSTVIGGATSSPTGAALLNGYQITAFTMCDVYRPALCHITPEVVPAVLAVAESRHASGRELLTGIAVGLEITTRLGLGVDYPRFRARGWHAPGVIGTIGAACAAARVIGLDERGVRAAMGLGVSQASGTFAALGTSAVKFHQARGAVSGLWAAMFTADGLGGTEQALTHPDGGLLNAYCDGGNPDLVTAGLGEHWELANVSLRRWPAASSLQSLVATLLEGPAAADGIEPERITGLEIALPPTSYAMCADMGWQDELSAMQSARYVSAVVLHDRRCWIEQFSAPRRADPAVDDFATRRVRVVCDEALPASGVELRITQQGSTSVHRRAGSPGEPGEPLTGTQLRTKLANAATTSGVRGGARLDHAVFGVGRRAVGEVCAALRVPTSDELKVVR